MERFNESGCIRKYFNKEEKKTIIQTSKGLFGLHLIKAVQIQISLTTGLLLNNVEMIH